MSHQLEEARLPPYYRSPGAIRNETFNHRMRGLDEAEVRAYLELLADQVQAADAERAGLRAEVDRLRRELERHGDDQQRAEDEISPHAVALFSQAQQVADQLVEEAVRHARDLMTAARHQQREILEHAHETAQAAAGNLQQIAQVEVDEPPGEPGRAGAGIPLEQLEYVRTFAKVAQAQLRSVVDALAEQVDRLGEVPTAGDGLPGLALQRAVEVRGAGLWQVRDLRSE
jgi:cell division initiation protein